ncbi:MAG TPA: hypothetical protein VGH28_10835 [Polyangiaceae bacterium]|jgi:hypothetical protein
MTPEKFAAYLEKARGECRKKLEKTKDEYGLGTYESFDLDLAKASLTFSDGKGRVRVRSRIQAAGSWSRASSTWLWSWDNESIPEVSKRDLARVRKVGEREGVPMMVESFESCGEIEAWAMTAVAGHVLKCEGFYRVPNRKNDVFLLLFDLQAKDKVRG